MANQGEAPGQTWDTLEKLCLLALWEHLGVSSEELVEVAGLRSAE